MRMPPQLTTVTHPIPRHPARISWARLLKRVFDIDMEHCSQCGGALKIIAANEDPTVIAKILTHLGLPARHLRYAVPAPLAGVRASFARHSPIPITGAGIRPIPNSLIPNRSTLPSGLAPEPTSPFSAQPPETPKRPETSRFGSNAPESSPILDRGLECLTSFRFSSTFPFEEKGRLNFWLLSRICGYLSHESMDNKLIDKVFNRTFESLFLNTTFITQDC